MVKPKLTKLTNIICNISLILIAFFMIFFVFIKNTLEYPNTYDIRIISVLTVLFILSFIAKSLIIENNNR